MDNLGSSKWNACMEHLRSVIPARDFGTWFEPIRFLRADEGTLSLQVPTKVFVEFLRERYAAELQSAVRTQFGADITLYLRPQAEQRAQPQAVGPQPQLSCVQQQPRPAALETGLNPRYVFENFVEGQSNRLARAVALSIAQKPGQTAFNPLFLYGPSGVGKTHLVNAIGLRLLTQQPQLRVLYVPAQVFKTQYTDSVIRNKQNEFIHFYQSIDVLIIDDIQEITTARTQQAFFHIFNHLHLHQRQLIITCDQPPARVEGFEERLLTRFKWGAQAELERPDIALRRAILEAKLRRDSLRFPRDVVQFIAAHVESNVRELEGTVNSIMACSLMADSPDITLDLARRVVARLVNLERRELSADDLLQAVATHYALPRRDLLGKSRRQPIVLARQVAMYLTHKYTDLPLSQIGRRIGGRDHSTVLYSLEQVARRISSERDFRREVEVIEAALGR